MKLNYSYWTPYFILLVGTIAITYYSLAADKINPKEKQLTIRSAGSEVKQVGYFMAIDLYKLEVTKQLSENDLLMFIFKSDLEREGKSGNSYYINQVNNLEQKNRELENRIKAYIGNDPAGWAGFKDAFDNELESLHFAFRSLGI